ncbi:MAG TPA: mandelate racemase/muconate lactonizing enzyme family protein, partial [Methylomirabilota bacterium]|nr:mandelate racemase/muconate lactonizing enzyme family protein [Methylomirabilota bacterium]
MKITAVVVHRLSLPLPRPVRTARHDHTHADTVAVELRTDDGLVGSGYCFAFGARRARALAELVEDLAECYVGRAPAPHARHAEAWRALNFVGHAGLSLMALCPLDTACWDLAARAAGQPLFRYLGGDRTRVPT